MHAGNAQASLTATASANKDALTCGCPAGPATAQALSQAIAQSGGCGSVGNALAGGQARALHQLVVP
jgi:hypothetical protein